MRLASCALVPLAIAACSSSSGPIADALINNQADDPCDPGSGGISGGSLPPVDAGSVPVTLPGAPPGIGLDDIRFSATLSQILVPAGRTGNLDFVDPSSEVVAPVGGFSSSPNYVSGDDSFGVTSADEGGGIVYATDRTSQKLTVVDGHSHQVMATAPLAGTPGYVRYVAPTNEVWVTEPPATIEIFTLPLNESMPPTSAAKLAVPAAESLAVDATNGLALTNGNASTYAIDVTKRMVTRTWSNGCKTARGLAVDSANGWVMVACEGGLVSVLDEKTGNKTIGGVTIGSGLDQMSYDAATLRLYAPSPNAAAMAVIHLDSKSGMPTVLGSVDTPRQSHCVVAAGGRELFVCAPGTGQLLFVNDPF
jgi:hypothetical protein